MKKVLDFIKKEFFEMLPSTLFFLVVFCLTVFTRDLMYSQGDVSMRFQRRGSNWSIDNWQVCAHRRFAASVASL